MYIAVDLEPTAWLTSILPLFSLLKTLIFAIATDYHKPPVVRLRPSETTLMPTR
jgi:hypothetical protein